MSYKAYPLKEFIATIDAFNRTRPDMDGVRQYNHQMIDTFHDLRNLAGKSGIFS